MIQAAQLVTKVSTEGVEKSQQELKSFGEVVKDSGGFLKTALVGAAAMAGVAVVGLGVQAVKMAGDFQSGMTSLVTGAGESAQNLKMVSDGILDLSVKTGTSTKELTAGMYMIESSGLHGKAGLDALAAASRGAKVGAASLQDVANGVTTAMTDYSKSGLTAAQATNTLIATVAAGKTHMGDLANAMSTILPTAASVGVSFTDVSGAMATMTGEGTDAASASTYLRQMLMALENPAAKGAKALKEIGLTSEEVSTDMKKSLPDTLKLITDHLKSKFPEGSAAYIKALADISGGSKQMQGMLELTGDHLKTFAGNVSGIGDAVKKGGSDITGWNKVTEDFSFKMEKVREVVEVAGIKIGTFLLPILGELADLFSAKVGPAVQFVSDVIRAVSGSFTQVATPIQQVHTAMAPLLDTFDRASGYIKKTIQVAQPLTDTFDRAKGILTQTHQAAQPLLDTFDRATSIFKHTQAAVVPVHDALRQVADTISSFVVPIVHDFFDLLNSPQVATFKKQLQDLGTALMSGVGPAFTDVKPKIDDVFNFVKTVAIPALGDLIEAIAKTTQFLKDHASQVQTVAIIIGTIYTPAIIKAGIESAIAGAKIEIEFVSKIIMTGVEGLAAVGKLTVFIATMIATGAQAVANGALIVAGFIGSLIRAGAEALVSAALNGNYVASLIVVGAMSIANGVKVVIGIVAAFVLSRIEALKSAAVMVGPYVAALGIVAAISIASAAKMIASFVWALITTGTEAATTAYILVSELVPSLLSVAIDGVGAAIVGVVSLLAALPELIVGFLGWAAAAWAAATGVIAATWPVLAIIAAIGILVAIIVVLGEKFGWFGDQINAFFGGVGDQISKFFGWMGDQAKNMAGNVTGSTSDMNTKGTADMTQLSDSAQKLMQKMSDGVSGSFAQMDQNAIKYWNHIAQVIDDINRQAQNAATNDFIDQHHLQKFRSNFGGEPIDSSAPPPGHADGILNSPTGHWAKIGERGPETMFVPKGASIFPHGATPAIASQFAATVASSQPASSNGQQTVILEMDGHRFGHVIMPHIADQMRYTLGVQGS